MISSISFKVLESNESGWFKAGCTLGSALMESKKLSRFMQPCFSIILRALPKTNSASGLSPIYSALSQTSLASVITSFSFHTDNILYTQTTSTRKRTDCFNMITFARCECQTRSATEKLLRFRTSNHFPSFESIPVGNSWVRMSCLLPQ